MSRDHRDLHSLRAARAVREWGSWTVFVVLIGLTLLGSAPLLAAYNANMVGVVTGYWSYMDTDDVYFTLSNQPSAHPACNPSFFVIPSSVPADRRKMAFARLAQAYVAGEPINIGFDATGECAIGYIRVHRVG